MRVVPIELLSSVSQRVSQLCFFTGNYATICYKNPHDIACTRLTDFSVLYNSNEKSLAFIYCNLLEHKIYVY